MTVHQMPRLHRPKPLRPVTESRERRREEAADAGTPFDRLRDLSLTNPSLVLKNPAFELAVVTEPGFLLDLPEDALCALVRQPAFPQDLMVVLARRRRELDGGGKRVVSRIATHPNAPREALEILGEEPLAQLNVNSPSAGSEPWLETVARIAGDDQDTLRSVRLREGDARVTAALARTGCIDGHDPFSAFVVMVGGTITLSRYMRAQRSMSERNLRTLVHAPAEHGASYRRQLAMLCRRTETPSALLSERERAYGVLKPGEVPSQLVFASKMTERMRATMAASGELSEGSLRRLASDRQWQVRSAVAVRPGLPIELLRLLAADPDRRVRASVARATPEREVLERLARDEDLCVQFALAHNPCCAGDLEDAITDVERIKDGMVRSWAAGTPREANGMPFGQSDASDAWSAEEAAIVALRHAYDSIPKVLFVAGPRCPVEVLEAQAESACWWARVAVARNPRTPAAVVAQLASEDANWLVRAAARERMESPPDASRLPEPIPAERCSERHMPGDVRARLGEMRTQLGEPRLSVVCTAVSVAFDDPDLRPILCAGMLVSRRGVRLTGYSEIGRKVRYEHRAAAEAQLGVKLGVAQLEEE
jgi:hypothetical protein